MLAELRVLQPRPHLLAHELGDLLAHRFVEEYLGEGGEPELQRAVLVDRLQHLAALRRRQVGPSVLEVVLEASEGVRKRFPELRRTAPCRPPRRPDRISGSSWAGRIAASARKPVRCPTSLAMVWMTWMPVAPMPTTPTRLPAKSTGSRGQRAVWKSCPLKVSWPGNRLLIGAESIPQQVTRNCVSMVSPLSVLTVQRSGVLVVMGARDGGVELDVLAKVEAVGDIVHPPLDLRLARESLAPAPSLVELFREEILVDVGLGVEARAGIAVPVPSSADVRCAVTRPDLQSLVPEQVQLVKSCDTRADDQRVELLGMRFPVRRTGTLGV